MFKRYEIRISIATWNQKWVCSVHTHSFLLIELQIYLVARFITYTNDSNGESQAKVKDEDTRPISSNGIPYTSSSSLRLTVPAGSETHLDFAPLGAHPLALEDGTTLHCIAVSQLVFKHGRITIPPALGIALNGFSRAPAPDYASGPLPSFSATMRHADFHMYGTVFPKTFFFFPFA